MKLRSSKITREREREREKLEGRCSINEIFLYSMYKIKNLIKKKLSYTPKNAVSKSRGHNHE